MKVIHYTSSFSPLSQTFIYDLVTGLENRGLTENIVLARRRELKQERPFDQVYICKETNPFRKLYYNLKDPSHLIIRNQNCILRHLAIAQVVHSHFAISALRMHDLLEKNSIALPHVCSFHGNDVQSNPHKIPGYKEALLRINHSSRVRITVPSNFLKNVCLELGMNEDKIQIMSNTFHPRFLEHQGDRSWDGKEKLKIVTIGRLVEMKGHIYAIEAMAKLKSVYPNFEYIIGGSGTAESELRAAVERLDLQEHVKFLGNISHAEVPQILKSAHICLIPSVKASDAEEDTFCLSLLEGSVVGLYCLCSDTRGPQEVLGENTDFIFKQKDPKAIFEKLVEAIESPEKMKKKAQELSSYMVGKFHPDVYFKNFLELYRSML